MFLTTREMITMRELTVKELKAVSGGLARPLHPGENGIRNAINPLNKADKPKGWAGAVPAPETR